MEAIEARSQRFAVAVQWPAEALVLAGDALFLLDMQPGVDEFCLFGNEDAATVADQHVWGAMLGNRLNQNEQI